MAVDSGSIGKQKKSLPAKKKNDEASKENDPIKSEGVVPPVPKRNKSPGVRMIHGRIYDSTDGKTCHQCRQKTRDLSAVCKGQRNGKPCPIMFCHKCLLNRYGEKAEEVTGLGEWSCPRCRGICNCSFCMKKRGCQPTGILTNTAKAAGYSSVSEMLLKGGTQSKRENPIPDTVALPTKETWVSSENTRKDNSLDEKDGAVLPKIVTKESKKAVKVKVTEKRKADQEVPTDLDTVNDTCAVAVNNGAHGVEPVVKKPKKAINDTDKREADQDVCTAIDTVKDTGVIAVNKGKNDTESVVKKPKKARNDAIEKKDATLAKRTSPRKLQTSSEVSNQAELKLGGDIIKESHLETFKKNTIAVLAETANGYSGSLPEPLTLGKKLSTVPGIEMRAQDVGNALQFSEFCAVFREVLHIKKGHAEHVLQDIFHGRTGRRGKISPTVQFHIDLLSFIKEEQGEKCAQLTMYGKSSWFNVLKECLSGSEEVLKRHGLELLDNLPDYETLDESQKLRLLNVLCDEVLGLDKVRYWIGEQNEEFADHVKEAREKLKAARDEENNLKTQQRNSMTAAIEANNGGPLSIAKYEAIVSRLKPKMKLAHDKVLESKRLILNHNQYPDAFRAEAILIDQGQAYWKLNTLGKANMLCQKIGKGDDTDTRDEEWLCIDTEGEKLIEKHDHFLREKRKAEERTQIKAKKEHKRRKEAESVNLPE